MTDNGQLYFGGDIYTVDENLLEAFAVAVKDSKIIAVGALDHCSDKLGDGHEVINLNGSCLMPGFIDTHLHPILMIYFDLNVDMRGCSNMDQVKEKIREMAEKENKPGAWIVGLQFDEEELDEPRFPNRHDLDQACPDYPAVIIKHDGHTLFANTKAMEAAKISKDTADPEGGKIEREEDGNPSGVLFETASQLVMGCMPAPDLDSLKKGADYTFSKLASQGITTIGTVLQTDEEGPAGSSGAFDVLGMIMLQDRVPMNMYSLLISKSADKIKEAMKSALHTEELGGRRIGGIKIYMDGTFGACTAYMEGPFSDNPDSTGFLTTDQDIIFSRMAEAHKEGMQVAVHAIGDKANQLCVDMYERLFREHPRDDCRHRIEHASLLDQKTIDDMARLGLVAAVQPLFIHSEKHWLHKRLGPERARMTYPFRSLLDAGVRLAGASDGPVESTDVLHAIQCCVLREGFEPRQGITTAEAVRMFTIDAAFSQFEDDVRGSITVGKQADMVVLSENPLKADPVDIRNIRVEKTICGGKLIYEA
jgi:predicted amidohydrolase YtcJ